MEGWELYELYVKYNKELNNTLVETWEEMAADDKIVWNKMANNLPD